MAETRVVFYREADGTVPVLDWIEELARRDKRVRDKCLASIALLKVMGRQLRRPFVDNIGECLWELRIHFGHVNYRILYFLREEDTAVLLHGFTKEASIPNRDKRTALARKRLFEENAKEHTHDE